MAYMSRMMNPDTSIGQHHSIIRQPAHLANGMGHAWTLHI
jgi:hypothetical protein